MDIEKFFTTTFTLFRQTWSNESSAEVSQSSFVGHIQQTNERYQNELDIAYGLGYKIWCAFTTDIQAGDRVNDGTNDYSVKTVVEHYTGPNKHKTVIVIKDNAGYGTD